MYNIQAKGVPLDSYKNDDTITVRLEFDGDNVDFINLSAEVDYGRRS